MQIHNPAASSLSPDSSSTPLSSSPSHQPALPWSNGMPSPPRILVPPPTLVNDPAHRRTGHPYGNPFNKEANNNGPLASSQLLASSGILPISLQDWRYESRREAQQILPHIYLGPLSAAKDLNFLRRENITLLVAVRNNVTARARLLNAYNEILKDPQLAAQIRFESIDTADNQELIHSFPQATKIIDDHLYSSVPSDFVRRKPNGLPFQPPNPNKTLIYCESGNERSAAVCAAYIMEHISCNAVQAIQIIQGRRFCVCFDDAMKYLLTGYEPIWMARRDVELQEQMRASYGQTGNNPSFAAQNVGNTNGIQVAPKKGKRGIEEAYDDEENGYLDFTGGSEHDAARFEKREGIAPFSDSMVSQFGIVADHDMMRD